VVVLGSGYIHDATTLARLPQALGNSIVDATWIGGELFTARNVAGATQFQHWAGPDLSLQRVVQKSGMPHSLFSVASDRLLAIRIGGDGIPVLTLMNGALEEIPAPMAFSSISGYVYADVNNDGLKAPQESGISGVTITIDGPTTTTVTTNDDGFYLAERLLPGSYTITERHPLAFLDGRDSAGTYSDGTPTETLIADDTIQVDLERSVMLQDFNFGERGLQAGFVSSCSFFAISSCQNPLHGLWIRTSADGGPSSVTFRANGTGSVTLSADGEAVLQVFDSKMNPVAHGPSASVTADLVSGDGYVLYVAGNSSSIQLHVSSAEVTLETASVPIHNRLRDTDVNLDGHTTPVDVLTLINYLNAGNAPPSYPAFVDVNGDHAATPVDVLMVINVLNSQVTTAAEGEGQTVLPRSAGSHSPGDSPEPSRHFEMDDGDLESSIAVIGADVARSWYRLP
jgi:hypothetical protein